MVFRSVILILCLQVVTTWGRAKETWLSARTANFELYSDASARDIRELLNDLEDFRSMLLAGLKLPPGREPLTRVVAFRNDREFDPYKPLYNGKTKDVAGYFTGGEDASYIAISMRNRGTDARRVILHEYFHQLAHTHGLDLPPWLNEGLAEFYSTFRMHKGQVVLGDPVEDYVKFLRQVVNMSMRELVNVNQNSKEYNEGIRQGVFYAKSWALVHFMFCGKSKYDFSQGIARYIVLGKMKGLSAEERFQKAFGVDYETMDNELRRYLRGGRFYTYRGKVEHKSATGDFTLQEADPVLLDCTLIGLESLARDSGDAHYRLLELADAHPKLARVPELLGSLSWRHNRYREALPHWEKAIELGSDNPFVYMQVVKHVLLPMKENANLAYRFPETLATKQRDLLNRVLDLSPDYGDAYEMLALLEAFAETPDIAGINRVQRNISHIADARNTYLYLGIFRLHAGDTAMAQQFADVLEKADISDYQSKRLLGELIAARPQ